MLDITFRNLDSSLTVHWLARSLLSKLGKNHGEPARCHLVLEDTRGAHAASHFSAHLELTLAHADMSFQAHAENRDAATAVREAYDHIERQLERFHGRRAWHRRVGRA